MTSPETLPQRFYSASRPLFLLFQMLLQRFSSSLITPSFAKLLSQQKTSYFGFKKANKKRYDRTENRFKSVFY